MRQDGYSLDMLWFREEIARERWRGRLLAFGMFISGLSIGFGLAWFTCHA